ncbi:MAG TPA: hypothetical protein VEZ50_15165 [Nodosilinea sp.]|nr:hypothetical protein [Nodosilinea sp.]
MNRLSIGTISALFLAGAISPAAFANINEGFRSESQTVSQLPGQSQTPNQGSGQTLPGQTPGQGPGQFPPAQNQSPGQMQQTPGQMQQTPGQMQQTPGQMQQTPGQMQQTPGQMRQTPGQMQQTPGQMQQTPGEMRQAPGQSQNPNEGSRQVPPGQTPGQGPGQFPTGQDAGTMQTPRQTPSQSPGMMQSPSTQFRGMSTGANIASDAVSPFQLAYMAIRGDLDNKGMGMGMGMGMSGPNSMLQDLRRGSARGQAIVEAAANQGIINNNKIQDSAYVNQVNQILRMSSRDFRN